MEEDEVSFSANLRGKINESIGIDSKIKTNPEEPWNICYKVTFGSDRLFKPESPFRITHFERQIVHVDPEHQCPFIYDTRIID